MTDWQNSGKQGSQRYPDPDDENKVIYRSRQGDTYQAADGAGWLPGIYADEAAAVKALDVIQTHADELTALAHWEVRGKGDAYQPITVADLNELTRNGT